MAITLGSALRALAITALGFLSLEPETDKVRAGVEFIWGSRVTLDGSSGDGTRLMGTFRYDFGVPYQ